MIDYTYFCTKCTPLKAENKALRAEIQALKAAYKEAGYMCQHEDTGQICFIDSQQVEWGFFKNNPRLQNIGKIYRRVELKEQADEQTI